MRFWRPKMPEISAFFLVLSSKSFLSAFFLTILFCPLSKWVGWFHSFDSPRGRHPHPIFFTSIMQSRKSRATVFIYVIFFFFSCFVFYTSKRQQIFVCFFGPFCKFVNSSLDPKWKPKKKKNNRLGFRSPIASLFYIVLCSFTSF